jgi:peptidoglycan/xylan/chitin deacetylase (PgdA/CDA1 family)
MRYVRAHFDPVPLSTVVDHLVNGTSLPNRPAVITFDDGYDDNLHYAAPILRRHSVPATIFVSTDYIGGKEPYWFELAVYLMMRLPPGALRVSGVEATLPTADDWQSRRRSGHTLQRALMKLDPPVVMQQIRQWREEFAAHIDPAELRLSGLLDWEAIRAMDGRGIEFGSHTRTHPVLSMLNQAALRDELFGSRERLESELRHAVTTIAYPVGKEFAFSPQVESVSREAGYQLGASYMAGMNWLSNGVNWFALRRQNIERGQHAARFSAMVQFPEWVQW